MRRVLVAVLSLVPLTGWSTARAEDLIAERENGGAVDRTLQFDGESTTEVARFYRHGFYRRGFYGGFRRGFRPYYGFRYSYRPYYRSYYYGGPSFRFSYGYRPYYSYYRFRPYYYYSYRPYYSSFYSYCGGATAVPTVVLANCLPAPTVPAPTAPAPSQGDQSPVPGQESQKPGTYEYDGGPQTPPPMPKPNGNKSTSQPPRPTVPLRGRFVSYPGSEPNTGTGLRTEPERLQYPAYGEAR